MTTPKAKWTILTYIAAHNNLDQWGQRSIDQILATGSTSEVKLAALYDGQAGARRVIAGAPNQPMDQESLGSFDSGDPLGLVETVKWAFERCPAERYGLVLWSHGSGWRPEEIAQIAKDVRGDEAVSHQEANDRSIGSTSPALFRSTLQTIVKKDTPAERAICFDDGTQHSLDTLELDKVVTQIREFIGQPLDLLGMDACLMATLEVAYQMRHNVRTLVASEELVPASSWPYDTILGMLQARPEMGSAELAKLIVDRYLAYYTVHPPHGGDVTNVALDLARVEPVAAALNTLAAALRADMIGQADKLKTAQNQCVTAETHEGRRLKNKFQVHLWDLGTLSRRLTAASDDPAVKSAASELVCQLAPGRFVLAEGHAGDWFKDLAGVSVYAIVPKRIRITPEYGNVALAQDTQWLQMLREYDDEMKNR